MLKRHAITIIFLCLFVFPLTAIAQVNYGGAINKARDAAEQVNDRAQTLQNQVQSSFCSRIEALINQQTEHFSLKRSALQAAQQRRNAGWDSRQTQQRESLEKHRGIWDANRLEHFAKLRARAAKFGKSGAVDQFIRTLEEAIRVRRSAVDSAQAAYQAGIDEMLDQRKHLTDAAFEEYTETINELLTAAKTDCENGVEASSIKSIFVDSLQIARQTLEAAKTDLEDRRMALQQLQDERRAAIANAIENFQSVLSQAKLVLKNELGEE